MRVTDGAAAGADDASDPGVFELALFPLRHVLFPGGVLALRVFEARYLDLVAQCMRDGAPFGVVCLSQGEEVQRGGAQAEQFEALGVLARIDEVDAEQAGILRLRACGTRRFALAAPATRQHDGLWRADARLLADDPPQTPAIEHEACIAALRQAHQALQADGSADIAPPLRYDDAGWVANRWCELLPVSLAARQRLMALDDPALRLRLVDEFLRDKGVVVG